MEGSIWASVFGVSDIVRFKSACSATETSQKIEILLVASLDIILSNKRKIKALIRLRGCEDRFSRVEAHFMIKLNEIIRPG